MAGSQADNDQARDPTFSQIAKLPGGIGKNAAANLEELYKELLKVDARTAARRLAQADRGARELPFPVLERLIAPERVLAEVEDTQQPRVQLLHIVRNVAALLPLLLTWLSLAIATIAYQQQLSSDPDLVTQPFMLLWEQRFGGLRWVPPFSLIAGLDTVLIVLLVVATVWIHSSERDAAGRQDRVAEKLDSAMTDLAIALEQSAVRTGPATPKDWAKTAQRIITEAMTETKQLAEENRKVVASAERTLESARAKADDVVNGLLSETRGALDAVREANEKAIDRSLNVLREGIAADRSLVTDQMAPLVKQFETTVAAFGRDYETYQSSTARFVELVSELRIATQALADTAASQASVSASVDEHLKAIGSSQSALVSTLGGTAESTKVAAASLDKVSTALDGRMRADLEQIAASTRTTSERLATVDQGLQGTTTALENASTALEHAAVGLRRRANGGLLDVFPFWPRGRAVQPEYSDQQDSDQQR